ncbi:hypothetical protein AB0D05_09050 [Micrococcus luteus]|uniref:hypothetical protein n=1 Tax=Micrococcus luteus TaxID=1270 RepID=UPI0033D542AD
MHQPSGAHHLVNGFPAGSRVMEAARHLALPEFLEHVQLWRTCERNSVTISGQDALLDQEVDAALLVLVELVVGDVIGDDQVKEAPCLQVAADVHQSGLVREEQVLNSLDVCVVRNVGVLIHKLTRDAAVGKLLRCDCQQLRVNLAVVDMQRELLEDALHL